MWNIDFPVVHLPTDGSDGFRAYFSDAKAEKLDECTEKCSG